MVAAEREKTELSAQWPNGGVNGVWWLRRFSGIMYSQSVAHNPHPRSLDVPLKKDVLMTVDMDAGTIKFRVEGEDADVRPHTCTGIDRAVQPAVFFYDTDLVVVSCKGPHR